MVVLPGRNGAVVEAFMMVPSGVPVPSGPVPTPSGRMVAKGVPRVSTDTPRSGWKVLTKSRWSPRSSRWSRTETVAMTFQPSESTSPKPPAAVPR